jgi:hypothetical protein
VIVAVLSMAAVQVSSMVAGAGAPNIAAMSRIMSGRDTSADPCAKRAATE